MLTFVTIPHATTISAGWKNLVAEEVGSIFLKSATLDALFLLRGAGPIPLHRQINGGRGT